LEEGAFHQPGKTAKSKIDFSGNFSVPTNNNKGDDVVVPATMIPTMEKPPINSTDLGAIQQKTKSGKLLKSAPVSFSRFLFKKNLTLDL